MRPLVVIVAARWLGPHWAMRLVPGYITMLVIGSLFAAVLMVDAARRAGFMRSRTLSVLMIAYLGGLVGASMVPLLQALAALALEGKLSMRSGLAAYGGMIGGVTAAALALHRLREPIVPFLDATAPAMGLAYFFARLGCFLAGCDYGKPTHLALGVHFPEGSLAFRDHLSRGLLPAGATSSLAVHPTQLYSSFAGLALFLAVSSLPMRGDGRRLVAFVLGYATLRFAIELLRGDEARGALGPFSTSQLIATGTVIVTLVLCRRAMVRSVA